jgi:hypothetical protein
MNTYRREYPDEEICGHIRLSLIPLPPLPSWLQPRSRWLGRARPGREGLAAHAAEAFPVPVPTSASMPAGRPSKTAWAALSFEGRCDGDGAAVLSTMRDQSGEGR